MENGHSAFLIPIWGLRGNVYVYLRLIGKRVVHYISVNWTLFARCYGWGATSKHRL